MPPTPTHTLLPRSNDPSLADLFRHFPTTLWRFFKLSIYGISLILGFFLMIFAIFFAFCCIYTCISTYGPDLAKGLTTRVRIRGEAMERIWRLDRIWVWVKGGRVRGKDGGVDAEELRHLDSHDDGEEGREGSVGGETLLDDEEVGDGDEDGQASKEEMKRDSEDYMNGEA